MSTRNHTSIRCARAIAAALAVAFVLALLAPAPVHALSRATILARGARWVDLRVPYSQLLRFEGYRQDCSGFVSMCWALSRDGLPVSPSTADLDAASLVVPIAKEELQPGDMILRPKDQPDAPYGHSVLFVAWADPAHTRYIAYHESSASARAVMTTITYPFGSETGFAPYRYRGVDDDYLDAIELVYGQTRYETAVRASWTAFPEPGDAKAIVLATGENWPDALGGAALAGAVEGPVLLTKRDSLPDAVRDEIDRLDVDRVFVLGGTSSVATAVAQAVADIPGVEVFRIAGADRWETSALVAQSTREELALAGRVSDGAYIATGRAYPDALAVSPVAYAMGRPILLTDPSYLPTATAVAIASLAVTDAWLLGGEAAIGATATAQIESAGVTPERIAGDDRYATALAVAAHAESEGLRWNSVGLATGQLYADALAGGAAQGAAGSLLLLTPGGSLDAGVAAALTSHRIDIDRVRCYGGYAAIGDVTRSQIASAVRD